MEDASVEFASTLPSEAQQQSSSIDRLQLAGADIVSLAAAVRVLANRYLEDLK